MTDFMLFFLFRLFWALFLGFALTGSLKSTWNAEHGRKGPLWGFRSDNNTVVFLDPLVLPLCIVFYIGLCLLFFGWEKSRGYIFSLGVDLFFFISVYFVLVLFLLPALRTRYTARTCATFWVIPVFLFYQPTVIYNYDQFPCRSDLFFTCLAPLSIPFFWSGLVDSRCSLPGSFFLIFAFPEC